MKGNGDSYCSVVGKLWAIVVQYYSIQKEVGPRQANSI